MILVEGHANIILPLAWGLRRRAVWFSWLVPYTCVKCIIVSDSEHSAATGIGQESIWNIVASLLVSISLTTLSHSRQSRIIPTFNSRRKQNSLLAVAAQNTKDPKGVLVFWAATGNWTRIESSTNSSNNLYTIAAINLLYSFSSWCTRWWQLWHNQARFSIALLEWFLSIWWTARTLMSSVLHNKQTFWVSCLLSRLRYAWAPFFQLGCFSWENSTFLHFVWHDRPQKNLPLFDPLIALRDL